MNKNYTALVLAITASTMFPAHAMAQYAWQETDHERSKQKIADNMHYRIEMQASASKGKTPLWLNANKYGLSSLDRYNGYLRAAVERPLATDSARRWAVGYAADVAVPANYTSNVVVQQAYVEARWLHGVLSVGAKEYPMELKNQTLSSGSQTLGINARPVPQARLALPEYWTLPFGRGWLHLKGHLAFGMMTDDSWQHDVTHRRSKYADHVLYHSKAGYLKIGNDYGFAPLSLEIGLEMASLFGGTPHRVGEDGEMITLKTDKGLKGFWHALVPGGADATDGMYSNDAGDLLGSWVFRMNYDTEYWRLSFYGDHFFEDHSQMFLLDYNGYGSGDDWNKKKHNRYFMYKLKDIMLGIELNLKYNRWVRHIVAEYIYTKYQSGPYNHDRTENISDHIAGTDDYYNHSTYTGWQHWGMVIGNPLYRSPIYNGNGEIYVADNRFRAWHIGLDGCPTERLGYRVMATVQNGLGTYSKPFTKVHHNASFMAEASYNFGHGWKATAAYGMDFGSALMLGHNAGMQLTVSKTGLLKKRR